MNNKKITIFTPTYNRKEKLVRLYESLLRQTEKEFIWMVVDDGSVDDTKDYIDSLIEKGEISIKYLYQENHGKHVAHNTAVLNCETELFTMVDSDDYLSDDAIELILECWKCATEDNVGILSFRSIFNGKSSTIKKYIPGINGFLNSTMWNAYKHYGLRGETMATVKTSIARENLYPVFENEKFITEGYFFNRVDQCGEFIILPQVTAMGEYREDGLSLNYGKILLENGHGYLAFLEEQLRFDHNIWEKWVDTVRWIARCKVVNRKKIIINSPYPWLTFITYPVGVFLYNYRYKKIKKATCTNALSQDEKEKKQILICFTGAMELGGIEKSLLNILDAIDYNKYHVDLFLYGHHGVLFDKINKNVNIIPEVKELSYLRESFWKKIKHGCFMAACYRLRDAVFCSKRNWDETWREIMRKKTSKNHKEYDLAIGFFLPFDYIIEQVVAKKKVGWVHTDYRQETEKKEWLFKEYNSMDLIVAVSYQVLQSFESVFPELADKLISIENILEQEFIERESVREDVSQEMPEGDFTKILSVGRFCRAKNFENIPEICRRLLDMGHQVRWYLIGYGELEEKIKKQIIAYNVENNVLILGKKENPYPYMKACDIYIQPSIYEGKCVSVIEAQMLHKPVVITNYPTSSDQLRDGIDGLIVSVETEVCAHELDRIIKDKALLEHLIQGTYDKDYSNKNEIEKIYALMET